MSQRFCGLKSPPSESTFRWAEFPTQRVNVSAGRPEAGWPEPSTRVVGREVLFSEHSDLLNNAKGVFLVKTQKQGESGLGGVEQFGIYIKFGASWTKRELRSDIRKRTDDKQAGHVPQHD